MVAAFRVVAAGFAEDLLAARLAPAVAERDGPLAAAFGDRDAAVAFLAPGSFLAGPTLAGAGGHTPRASLGAADALMTASLNPLSGVILAFFDALTLTGSPVAGFRAVRAGRSTRANLAKPRSPGPPNLILILTRRRCGDSPVPGRGPSPEQGAPNAG